MMVAFERCKSPRKQRLPFSAWAWQISRLPGPAPRGKLDHAATLSPSQEKQSISDCPEGLISESECPDTGEEKKKTQRNFRTCETVLL